MIILRHDVDKKPENALVMAEFEDIIGITGTYYFRTVKQSFYPEIIRKIAGMGHKIGYHYEDITMEAERCRTQGAGRKAQGSNQNYEDQLLKNAIESFKNNLEKLRMIAPVSTICMHGSPLDSYDNRMLWEHYDYGDFDIKGEPYFDIDFSKVFYLTDTGRRWDGEGYSVRDKVRGSGFRVRGTRHGVREKETGTVSSGKNLSFRKTQDIIDAVHEKKLPDKVMMTIHPQRWTDEKLPWVWELIWQNLKNPVKRVFFVK